MFLLGHHFSLSFPTLTLSEITRIRIEIQCILFLNMIIFQMRKKMTYPKVTVGSDTVNLETLSIGSRSRDETQSHLRECSSSAMVGEPERHMSKGTACFTDRRER